MDGHENSLKNSYFSTNNFFEGSEKLLEIWFPEKKVPAANLLCLNENDLSTVLHHINCKIISFIENKQQRAFLLSESSLFIWKDKILIKTCGTTNLLAALHILFKLANGIGFEIPTAEVFYSRRRFLKPEEQPLLHQSFRTEVSMLEEITNGSAYSFGRLNSECWFLFTTATELHFIDDPDQTLEIIMSNLDENTMKIFTKKSSQDAEEATRISRIGKLFEGVHIDDYLFEPGGYSCNGIIEKYYFSIHITPEENCSYVSFETNIPYRDYSTVLREVIDIFKPRSFFFTLFTNGRSLKREEHFKLQCKDLLGDLYQRRDLESAVIQDYDLLFASFYLKNASGHASPS